MKSSKTQALICAIIAPILFFISIYLSGVDGDISAAMPNNGSSAEPIGIQASTFSTILLVVAILSVCMAAKKFRDHQHRR